MHGFGSVRQYMYNDKHPPWTTTVVSPYHTSQYFYNEKKAHKTNIEINVQINTHIKLQLARPRLAGVHTQVDGSLSA